MLQITNENLVAQLKALVVEERQLTTQILELLREVENRKLFLPMGYPSLFEFCTKELGYAEGAAHRRISAMRLIKDVPEVQNKILSGELSLSVASYAQSFFNNQKKKNQAYSQPAKLDLLGRLENVSTRECEKGLLKIDPKPAHMDCERSLTAELTELRLTVSADFMQKIATLKNRLSNSHPAITTQEVLAMALDSLLAKKDLLTKKDLVPPAQPVEPGQPINAPILSAPKVDRLQKRSRYVPVAVQRQVWQKSGGRCNYVDPVSGRRCSSPRFLQIDHIRAYAFGGTSSLENLQLLCANHNRWKGTRSTAGVCLTST